MAMAEKGSGGGGVLHHQRQQWMPDQRDAFIGWIRGEFAAANAIIDSLCQHLQLVGSPGEYDFVLGSIQQRRYSWSSVLHMQQYFSVAEVVLSLQQALARKQQQHPQQMPHGGISKGIVPPMPQKPYLQTNNVGGGNGGDGRQRRDFVPVSRRPPPPKGRAGGGGGGGGVLAPPPPPPAAAASSAASAAGIDQEGKKEKDGEIEMASAAAAAADVCEENSSSSLKSTAAIAGDLPQRSDDCSVSENLKEASRVKEAESTGSTVEVVETGQKADGQLCTHVFGEVKRAQLEHLATEILARTNAGDQSCIRGKLRAFLETSKRTPRSIPDVVHSMIDYLAGHSRGIFPGDARPNYFMLHVIDEGKSFSIEEKDTSLQPLCLVSLLAEPVTVHGRDVGQVTLTAGSVLKLQNSAPEAGISYAVGSDPCKRILVFLGVDQESRAVPPKLSKKQASSSAPGGSQPPLSPASRPGTGVYIPNSGSSNKCDIPISHRGVCVQDVR